MDRLIRRIRGQSTADDASYEPLTGDSEPGSLSDGGVSYEQHGFLSSSSSSFPRRRFSWVEYGVFTMLGIAMLWAW